MAVPVGSAYAEFYLEYQNLQADVDAIKGSLGELRQANDQLLASIRETGAGMAGAMQGLQNDLKNIKPLDPVVRDAKEARKQLGKGGAASEIRKDVVGELKALKQSLESSNTYAPIIKQAKQAGAAADVLKEKLDQLAAKQRAAKGSGFSREDLDVFFDEQGRIRDSVEVPKNLAPPSERDVAHLQRPFGRVASTITQTARIENLLENAPRGSEAASLESDTEAAKKLAEAARDAYTDVSNLEKEVADLRAELLQAGKVRVDIGQSFVDAEQALALYEVEQRKVITANEEIARTQREINELKQQKESAENEGVAAELAQDEDRYNAAVERSIDLAEVLEGKSAQLEAQQEILTAANHGLADATDLVSYAQERLNKAIGSEPNRRRTAAAAGELEAPNLDKQIEREEAARQRMAEAETEDIRLRERMQLESANRIAEIQLQNQGKIEAARLQSEALVEAEIRRGETSRYAVDVELQAATEKAQIESVGKIEHARIGAEDRQKRLSMKQIADREQAELEADQRITFQKLAQEGKINTLKERARIRQEEKDKRSAAKAVADAQQGTGLNKTETAVINRAKDQRDYAFAIDLVNQRLKQLNLTTIQRINLERLLAQLERQRTAYENQLNKPQRGGPSGGPGGPNLFNVARGQLVQFLGALGLATGAVELLAAGMRSLKDGFDIGRETEEAARTVGVFINNADRGSRVLQTAVGFGREYGFVQREMTEAARVLAPQIRNSNVALEKQFEIIARLSSRNPSQGFEGAAFATGELAAGDIQSMRDRFNIPGEAARKMKADVEAGMDVFVVLDKTLNTLGITLEALDQRMQGTSGQVRQFASGWDQLKVSIASIYTEGVPVLGFLGSLMARIAQIARISIGLSKVYNDVALSSARAFKPPAALQGLYDRLLLVLGAIPLYGKALDLAEAAVNGYAGANSAASAETERVSDAMSVAANRFQEGKIGAKAYADELKRIAEEQGQAVKPVPASVAGDLEKATDLLDDYHRQAAKDPGFAAKNVGQIAAVAAEVAKLRALTPVIISVELRTEYTTQALQGLQSIVTESTRATQEIEKLDADHTDAVRKGNSDRHAIWASYFTDVNRMAADFYANQFRADRDFNAGMARQARDFQAGLDRSDRDFRQGQNRAYRDYLEGIQRSTRDFGLAQAQQLDDFGRQQAQARAQFAKSEATALRDYERGRSRALRDHERDEAKAEQAHTKELVEIRKDADEKLIETQRETRKRLQDLQRDYDTDRKRATEDYELERAVLLAEGRLAEARVLESRFQVEQRRAAEDLSRGRSDVIDEGDQSAADIIAEREKTLAEARKTYDEQRAERKAAWDLMRQDQQDDYDLARKDAATAFAEQQAEAQAAFDLARERQKAAFDLQLEDARQGYVKSRDDAIADRKQSRDDAIADNKQARDDAIADREQARLDAAADYRKAKEDRRTQAEEQITQLKATLKDQEDTYKDTRKRILDDLDTFVKDTKTKLAETATDLIKVRQLVEAGIPEEQAQLAVAVARNNEQWRKVLGDMTKIAGFEGITAGTSWMAQLGQALIEGAKQVDKILQPDDTRRGLPTPAYSAPAQRPAPPEVDYRSRAVMPAAEEPRDRYVRMYEVPAPESRYAEQQAQRPIQITIMAPVTMDGRTVGQLVAPHVAEVFEGDLEVSASVIESTFTPGVHQRAFRRPL